MDVWISVNRRFRVQARLAKAFHGCIAASSQDWILATINWKHPYAHDKVYAMGVDQLILHLTISEALQCSQGDIFCLSMWPLFR